MNRFLPGTSSSRHSLLLLLGLNVLFYLATQEYYLYLLTMPLRTFVTMMHEMGHATACVATGGTVVGLTIVSNGADAAGLTWCAGGNMFFVAPAGYLGAAFVGCLLIWLGKNGESAKPVLGFIGVGILFATVFTIGKDLFAGIDPYQSIASLVSAVVIAGLLLGAGLKLSPKSAHIVLLIVAGQTALNALSDMLVLFNISTGAYGSQAMSDAKIMERVCGGSPAMWSVIWGVTVVVMLLFTLKKTFGGKGTGTATGA